MLREREANRRRQDLRSAISAAQKKRDEELQRQISDELPDSDIGSDEEGTKDKVRFGGWGGGELHGAARRWGFSAVRSWWQRRGSSGWFGRTCA
jgi:hypothetical protein